MPDSPTGTAAPADMEVVLSRFEASWRAGVPPRIDAFVPPGPVANTRSLLHELVLIDLNYRWRLAGSGTSTRINSKIDWSGEKRPAGSGEAHGASPLVLEDYVRQLPALGPLDRLSLELIGEEYRVRHLWGDRPNHGSYLTRFPARDAELRDLLASMDADLAADRPIPVAVPVTNDKPSQPGIQSTGQSIGPYRVLAGLGQGGTGQVFKARHENLGRIVAVKVIRPELMTDPEVVRRFYREMQLVSKLASPYIVHAFDAGPIGSMHCLVMEYVEGTDLRRLVKQSGPLPPARAAEYIRQAALGLQHIFEHQLVHRDIKPSNLIVVSGQWSVASNDKPASSLATGHWPLTTIKILDLGLARWRPGTPDEQVSASDSETSSSSLTPAGALMMGTPDYLAPEQALDFHAADIRADLYSLGCTFFFLLTGQPPFPGGTLAQKLLHHQHTPVPPLAQLRADLPAGYAPVIERLLAKRREDRYQTPAELVAALEALAQGRPASDARDETRGDRRRPSLRKLVAGIGGAALTIVLLSMIGFSLFRGTAPATHTSPRLAASLPKPPPTFSLWADQAVPNRPAADDAVPVELGVKFRSDVAGSVTALRFYKSPANTGQHVGHLWDAGGEVLASVTFTNETPSGWQSAAFPSAVPIKPNVVYIASYHTATGHYAADHHYFAGKGVDRGPLHALPDGVAGGNGVFRQGGGGFPTETFQSLNYWVDVVFQPTIPSPGAASAPASKAYR